MKKILNIIMLLLIFMFGHKIYAYQTLDKQTILELSEFSDLDINITKRPEITVDNLSSNNYKISDYTSGVARRKIEFYNVSTGRKLNTTVNVVFRDCATLNGKAVDIKFVYYNIVPLSTSDNTTCSLDFSCYGKKQNTGNEWYFKYIESVNMKVYFYYQGETEPIRISNGYISIFSQDGEETVRSDNYIKAYLTQKTTIVHHNSYVSDKTGYSYSDVYRGTTDGNSLSNGDGGTCFQYKNVDYLSVQMMMLGGTRGNSYWVGYHITFSPMTASLPLDPVKEVDKTETALGDNLVYTISQCISKKNDSEFYYENLVFSDILDKNLVYNSLKVYNSEGAEVTSSAGSTTYDSTTNKIVYTFNSNYLKTKMSYDGKPYKFVIDTNVKSTVSDINIKNSSNILINNKYSLNSNAVNSILKSKVIVHYIDENTGKKISDDVESTNDLFSTYTTESKNIVGYILNRNSGNTTGTMEGNVTEVTYYYIKQSNVTVKYVDENTGKEIPNIDSITTTFKEKDNYTTEKKDITGYTYTRDTENTSGTVGRENIEVVYYYKKNSNVTIRYVDKYSTSIKVSDDVIKSGKEGDDYVSEQKIINGYVFSNVEGQASGKLGAEPTTVTYYYIKQSNVTVKYIDLTNSNAKLADDIVVSKKQGETYTTEVKTFNGYTLTQQPTNKTVTVERDNITVTYGYKKNSLGVEVKYIDKFTGTNIYETVTGTGFVGDTFTVEEKEKAGYEIVTRPNNTNVTMTEDKITVIYEYAKLSNVKVIYKDITSNVDIETSIKEYKQGYKYTTTSKEFEGYVLSKTPTNNEGTVGREDITVIYEYKRVGKGITIKYIDRSTKTDLVTPIIKTGNVGDAYTSEAKIIEGYELVKTPTNANGNVSEEAQEVIYEYAKVSTLTISYIDLTNSNETLVDNIVEKLKEGDTYTLEAKTFNGYTLVEEPENNVVTMERKNITITYGYKKNSLGVEVKYIDKFTGSEIYPTVTQTGFVGDVFTVEEKEKAGYEIVTRPDSINITMIEDKITVTYEYAKISTLTVKYVDENNKELAETISSKLKQGDNYTTEEKDIKNYEVILITGNKTGTMGDKDIEIVYTYKIVEGKIIVTKVDKNNSSNSLSGAKFKIEKIDDLGNIDTTFTSQEKETGTNGKLEFTGLLIGKYRITEIKAPEGYILENGMIEREITKENREINILVANRLSVQLPETGAINYTLVICLSGLLVIFLAYILKHNKKVKQ